MRYPEFLTGGGTIGFLAPSFGCNIEPYRSAFDHALEGFRLAGYRTVTGPNCYQGCGVGISNTPELCGRELNSMYLGDEADVLLSCGGGELMCEVVPYMDFEDIGKVKPKWFMGYSDNTNFTFLSATLADTAAIYGPCAPSFGMEPKADSIKDAMALLTGEKLSFQNYPLWEKESLKDEDHPLTPYHMTEPYGQRIFRKGEEIRTANLRGRLLGGCVDCLVTLLGTRFDRTREFADRYGEDGIIWFLECCDLTPFGMRRAFFQMKQAGWFRHVRGFLIGRPLHFDEEQMGLDRFGAVLDVLKDIDVPVIMDVDLGHLPPMIPMITGGMADIRAGEGKLEIGYDLS